jgi:hypothetical protein
MYGNTAKSIGAKSGLYGGCFRHSNPSKSNSSWVVWEVCAEKIFDDWLKRCKKCVELNGDYVEKS